MPDMRVTGVTVRKGCVLVSVDLSEREADQSDSVTAQGVAGGLVNTPVRALAETLMEGLTQEAQVPGGAALSAVSHSQVRLVTLLNRERRTADKDRSHTAVNADQAFTRVHGDLTTSLAQLVMCDLCPVMFVCSQGTYARAGFAWDSTSEQFTVSDAVATQIHAFVDTAAQCRLQHVAPVVQCLPAPDGAAATATHSQPAQLQLQLEVPSRSRMYGWQPADSAVSAEAGALSVTPGKPHQMDVILLVRGETGSGYLPVSVSWLPEKSEGPEDESGMCTVNVQVRTAKSGARISTSLVRT